MGGNAPVTGTGEFWTTLALLSSLPPSVVVAYYIYRYRFLEIIVPPTITFTLLLLLTLAGYAAGVRRFGQYLEDEFRAPRALVERAFLAAIVLLFPPLSRWLEKRVRGLFSGELKKYRQLAETIERSSHTLLDVEVLKNFIEEKLRQEPDVQHVSIHLGEAPTPVVSASTYPLQTGGPSMGYLQIRLPQPERSAGIEESLRLLANEIAVVLEAATGYGDLIGASKPIKTVFSLIQKISETDVTVLLSGESGSGKELIARELHRRRPRADSCLSPLAAPALRSHPCPER